MVMSLIYIRQQCTLYSGFFLIFEGIFVMGRISSFYFLAGSICNGIYIVFILITRILSVGFGIDLTIMSIILCKMRQFLITTQSLISVICSCLATIDQFLVTSRGVSLRRCSKIEYAHRIIFIMIIIWCLHGIPFFVYVNIVPIVKLCVTTNAIYLNYIVLYTLFFLCVIPVLIDIVFGVLAYRNIRQTVVLAERHANRQLTKMTLIQVVLIIISITPVGILTAYNLITTGVIKDEDRKMKEGFAETIISLTSYFYYVVCYLLY
jgi:hypothetical protein